jgi:exopolysaccharide production protein ExoZ
METNSRFYAPQIKSSSFASIQVLRAIAALAVALFHEGALKIGYAGRRRLLCHFRFYNGFNRRERQRCWLFSKRFFRIVPLYWAVTLSMCLISLSPNAFRKFTFDFSSLAKSLLFIPYFDRSGEIEPLIAPGWTLNYEMFFYLVFTLGLAVRRPFMASHVVIAILVGWGLLATPSDAILQTYTNPLLLEFSAGLGLAQLSPHYDSLLGKALFISGILLFAFGAIVDVSEGRTLLRAIELGAPSLLLVSGAVIMERAGCWPRISILERIGDASYSFYLLHGIVIAVLHRILSLSPISMTILAVSLSVMSSIAVHRLFELPTMRFFRNEMRERLKFA